MDVMNDDNASSKHSSDLLPSNISREANRFGKRHILVLLGLLGFINVYALRVNLSVALVAMVNSTYTNQNSEVSSHECTPDSSTSEKSEDGTFEWDQDTQGIILGSFFYGYIFTQLPGGWIASKYGAKRVIGFGIFWTTALTLLTPLAARFSLYALVALRILEGLGEGVTFPAMHAMWSYWAPPLERTKLVPATYSGSQIGTIIAYPLSGWLCANGFAGGWPSVFYVFGKFVPLNYK
ncbi:sialin-like [Paramuricea clavata]|uniref:Sialin-like n=1 Tax=Paramuricea clavata TaxID=317549 RepID=A0A7D9E6Q1_PARCT|nr:sialin-like [Paramuricea clavata]